MAPPTNRSQSADGQHNVGEGKDSDGHRKEWVPRALLERPPNRFSVLVDSNINARKGQVFEESVFGRVDFHNRAGDS